jgi:hypothetical protein
VPADAVHADVDAATPSHCWLSAPFMPYSGPWPPFAGACTHDHRAPFVIPVLITADAPAGVTE